MRRFAESLSLLRLSVSAGFTDLISAGKAKLPVHGSPEGQPFRQREREKKAEHQSRAKRRLFDYDPNAIDDEDIPVQGGNSYDL